MRMKTAKFLDKSLRSNYNQKKEDYTWVKKHKKRQQTQNQYKNK